MAHFPYSILANLPSSLMPRLPLLLTLQGRSVEVSGLLDTGAAVNVLPYPVGVALGAIWEEQTTIIPLVGNLGQFEARVLIVTASHPKITFGREIRQVFAWVRSENAPIIFGQMNFLLEFDVCFFRSQEFFDVQLKNIR